VRLQRTGEVVEVTYVRREVQIPIDSARRKELRDAGKAHCITENGKFEITGWIEYLPLKVAYGSTVHKSQGLSLDAVQVNIRDNFFKSPGMLYVALSRCRTSEGLRLVGSEAALVERCAADPRLKAFL
jgi:ATP-dependent exoDNAse (exonuclease V) alpha subunit